VRLHVNTHNISKHTVATGRTLRVNGEGANLRTCTKFEMDLGQAT